MVQLTRRSVLRIMAGAIAMIRAGHVVPKRALASPIPGPQAWSLLEQQIKGKLLTPTLPWREVSHVVLQKLRNPFWIQGQPGGSQSTGWLGGWQAVASTRAIAAESSEDLAAGVRFCQQYGVRLVVKGTGHDYLGRHCAPDSLLLWTHLMRNVQVHDAFVPQGAPVGTEPMQAITVQAGVRWLDVYEAATSAGRYVLGGGCASVGACGGFILGGGFGSFSKRYGTGAGGLLEAEVITADGQIRRVNNYQDPELFFALRGGGGGSFAVLSEIILLSHPMPERLALITGEVQAADDDAYRELIEAVLRFYPVHLDNPHWGETIQFKSDNSLELSLTALDLVDMDVRRVIEQLLAPFRAQPQRFKVKLEFIFLPFADVWNADAWDRLKPGMITRDPESDASAGRFWWTGDGDQTGAFWNSYDSIWIPTKELREQPEQMAMAFFRASRHFEFEFAINKGLSGQGIDARQRDLQTALHPDCFEAAGLVICSDRQDDCYPGVPGYEYNLEHGIQRAHQVQGAMAELRKILPNSGTYGNEANYFLQQPGRSQWGSHLTRLQAIKQRVDPQNLFRVHNGIGNLPDEEFEKNFI